MRNLIDRIINRGLSPEEIERRSTLRAWDRELERSMTASHRQEINAIFSRHFETEV
jgi:hypothetical protein